MRAAVFVAALKPPHHEVALVLALAGLPHRTGPPRGDSTTGQCANLSAQTAARTAQKLISVALTHSWRVSRWIKKRGPPLSELPSTARSTQS